MAYLLSLIVNGVTRLQNDTHGTNIYADKHIKNNSNDNYILLGGGGHVDKGTFALANHGVHWEGFSKRGTSSATWGTLTSSNGYSPLFWLDSTNGGGVAFSDKSGQTFMQIDGYFYQNEGRYLVLDTNNYSSYLDSRYYTEAEADNRFVNVSGDTMTGVLTMNTGTGFQMKYTSGGNDPWMYAYGAPNYGIRYFEGSPDKMTLSASGNNNSISGADLCINGNGEGTVTIRGNSIWHAGNDGSGSGLDADTVDGYHASAFATAGHTHAYLPLSGGTLSGGITFKYGANTTDQVIQFSSTDSSDPQTVYLGIRRPLSSYGPCYKDNNGNWYNLIHSGNYTTYTVKKDGTGASGTWGINISGNAASADKLNSNAGTSAIPIYFDGGIPVQCTPSSLFSTFTNGYDASAGGWRLLMITIAGHTRSVVVGYSQTAGSVAWTGITGKPTTFTPSAHTHTASEVSGLPTSLKNPYALKFGSKTYDGSAAATITASDLGALTAHQTIYALTLQVNGTSKGTYNPASAAKTINIAVPTKTSQITNDSGFITSASIPTALKNPYAVEIKANGVSLGTYDGSKAATFNLSAANVGAANKIHTHTASEISGLPTKLSAFTNDVGYITGITKSMVEGVLTGNITSHRHTQYLTSALIPAKLFTREQIYPPGYFIITINNNNSKWLLSFDVKIVVPDGSYTIRFSEDNSTKSESWYRPSASMIDGEDSVKVKFGYSRTNKWVAILATVSYAGVSITNVANGYAQIDTYALDKLFTISFFDDWGILEGDDSGLEYLGTVQETITIYPPSKEGHTHTFASLISKPTTINGYGITDALTTSNYNSYVPTRTGTGASGTWGISISGNAATATSAGTAGNADTVDNYHASNLTKFYLSPMSSDAPADSAKSWFINTMPSASGAIVYNVPGSEKTIIVGKSSGAHGHMLQLNYDDNYLRILRYYGGSWKTTNWEKISAGYADSAGSVAWGNITGKPSTFTPSSHTHDYLPLSGGTMTGAINLSNTNAKLAFGSLGTSPITGYKAPSLVSNGVGIYSRYGGSSDEGAIIITEDTCVIYNSADTGWNFQVMDKDIGTDMTNDATRSFGVNQNHQAWSLAGFVKSGSSDSYVLLGGGGHKALSDFSMAHSHPYLPLSGGTCTGNIYAPAFYESSDERLKDFYNSIDVDLDKLSSLPKKFFKWKSNPNGEFEIGTSAQELQKIYPQLVNTDDKGYLTVAYDKLSIIALRAIDKLYEMNKNLEIRIQILESKQ